ncbi:response regulator transcription factor [candidate division WOR-3 bacterium]|nr:response regulator transcription factor [candidate division WOR-3 bacterium]
MEKLIYVIDDEPDILELVSIHLKKSRYSVKTFLDARAFEKALREQVPDCIILDLMLPDADGIDVCRMLRAHDAYKAVPVIMLTARSTEPDKILGLELGADDYITKPFSPRELVARVKAVLRRHASSESTHTRVIGGILEIDPKTYSVRIKGKPISLTSTEFKILSLLSVREGWVYTRAQILDHVWDADKSVIDRTVDVHIKHLRTKLKEAGQFIKNVRGVGYKLQT